MTRPTQTVPRLEGLLDVLCPWYIVIDAGGRICAAGAAIAKLNGGAPLVGTPLLEFLEVRRPKALDCMESLMAQSGRKLHLVTRRAPHAELKGVLAPLPEGAVPGVESGGVLSLSFGISVIDAVGDFRLNAADFAVTDLTVEMLYLVEAKSAVMQELRHLNTRLENAKLEAEEQAVTDRLTGLGNRRAMDLALGQMLSRKSGFAMMQVDLDHFKEVNDTHGHAAGDAVLQTVAERLRKVTRVEDTVARQGGDEFVLILPGVIDAPQITSLAQRLVSEIEVPIPFGSDELHVSASVGISIATDLATADPDLMMEQADSALYAVKEEGRNGFRIYTPEMGPGERDETAA
ncbi:MAG: diguanylate cyclase [Pseudomonadota bacterium]